MCLEMLNNHIEEGDAAVRLASTPINKYAPDALEKGIFLLREHGDLFPTTLKFDTLERQCDKCMDAMDMQLLLMMLCPWRAASGESDELGFRPTHPRLADIEGSPKDRNDYFRKKVLQFWCQGVGER